MKRVLASLLVGLSVAAGAGGCNPNPFCLNCVPQDGAVDLAPASAPDLRAPPDLVTPPDLSDGGCVPTNGGVEKCDGIDNNCDGVVDNVDPRVLAMDPNNCGRCANACAYPSAFGLCKQGKACAVDGDCRAGDTCLLGQCTGCAMGPCQPGHYDIDHDPADGCEYACIPTPPAKRCAVDGDCPTGIPCAAGFCGTGCQSDADCPKYQACDVQNSKVCLGELCDGLDNNCNGVVDEGFDLARDPANCGACNNACMFPNATAGCAPSMPAAAQTCRSDADCSKGVACTGGFCGATCGGDADCGLNQVCNQATSKVCVKAGGACALSACTPGYYDVDKNPADGCEYACKDAGGNLITMPRAEVCNGVDDDCDGVIDDHLTDVGKAFPCDDFCPPAAPCKANGSCAFALSQCAGRCCGVCTEGTTICAGGQKVCQMGAGPQLEVCDGVDNNCDGQIDEGFDLQNDPLNCGACNRKCSLPNAVAGCSQGQCTLIACQPGFNHLSNKVSDGCEYSCPVNPPTVETCNAKDDDCNGLVDDNLTRPPNFCVQTSICAGASPICCGAAGWMCNYPSVNAGIEVTGRAQCAGGQSAGNLVFSEALCDNLDGNCNGAIDESFTNLNQSCAAGVGTCQGKGSFRCDPANPGETTCCDTTNPNNDPTRPNVCCTAGAPCPAKANPSRAVDELCNGLDDDCDGQVDESTDDANATCNNGGAHSPCRGWHDPAVQVTVGGVSQWVYAYEASRPDASAAGAGASSVRACSNAGVLPWSPVTFTQAQAACAAVLDSAGSPMHLCDEATWQQACDVGVGPPAQVWSYGSAAGSYQPMTCNGADANRGAPWPTGSGAMCYAADASGRIYDLSGNVAEWTSTQVAYMGTTYYRVRGGAFNNLATGTSCNFAFVIEVPSYQYNDLGFRCCADHAP